MVHVTNCLSVLLLVIVLFCYSICKEIKRDKSKRWEVKTAPAPGEARNALCFGFARGGCSGAGGAAPRPFPFARRSTEMKGEK